MYSTMVANVLIKFGWYQTKIVGGEAFWNFQRHMVLYWQKIQSAIEFLIFARSPKNAIAYTSPYNTLFEVWLKSDEIVGVLFRKS